MVTTLETLKRHKRVESVSVESYGDLLLVTLAAPWSRYGTGRSDGYSCGFDADDGIDEIGREYTQAENAARALRWVRHEVFRA